MLKNRRTLPSRACASPHTSLDRAEEAAQQSLEVGNERDKAQAAEAAQAAADLLTQRRVVKALERKRRQAGHGSARANGPERSLRLARSGRPLRILCIDGGGVKGLNPTLLLQAIEARVGRDVRDCFDLICGTSIGAAMAMCISLGASLETGIAVLREMAETRVMVKSSALRLLTTGSKISAADLDPMVLDTVARCGVDEPAAAVAPPPSTTTRTPHFFMTTCCMNKSGSWTPFVNSNYERKIKGRPFQIDGATDWPLFERMRAAVAAPTFFPPHVRNGLDYVDAAIVANNPTLLAMKEARNIWPNRPIGCVVSLGCGKVTNRDGRSGRSGLTYWAGTLLSMPMEVYRIHKEFQASLPYINGDLPPPLYFRLEPPTGEYELDESRRKVLDQMCEVTRKYVRAKKAKLDRLALTLLSLSDEQAGSAAALLEQIHTCLADERDVQDALKRRKDVEA